MSVSDVDRIRKEAEEARLGKMRPSSLPSGGRGSKNPALVGRNGAQVFRIHRAEALKATRRS